MSESQVSPQVSPDGSGRGGGSRFPLPTGTGTTTGGSCAESPHGSRGGYHSPVCGYTAVVGVLVDEHLAKHHPGVTR